MTPEVQASLSSTSLVSGLPSSHCTGFTRGRSTTCLRSWGLSEAVVCCSSARKGSSAPSPPHELEVLGALAGGHAQGCELQILSK